MMVIATMPIAMASTQLLSSSARHLLTGRRTRGMRWSWARSSRRCVWGEGEGARRVRARGRSRRCKEAGRLQGMLLHAAAAAWTAGARAAPPSRWQEGCCWEGCGQRPRAATHRLDEDLGAVGDARLVVCVVVGGVGVHVRVRARRAADEAAVEAAVRAGRRGRGAIRDRRQCARGQRRVRGSGRAARCRCRCAAAAAAGLLHAVALRGIQRGEAVRPEEAAEAPPRGAAVAGVAAGGDKPRGLGVAPRGRLLPPLEAHGCRSHARRGHNQWPIGAGPGLIERPPTLRPSHRVLPPLPFENASRSRAPAGRHMSAETITTDTRRRMARPTP
jgi:hypothetical protein